MKLFHQLLLTSIALNVSFAADYPRVIFTDDFSGDAFGPRWLHYKSASVVKDGVLVGITPEGSDHAATDLVKFEPERDVEMSVRFKFTSEKAEKFNVHFDDPSYRGSHAGHICNVFVTPKSLQIHDGKTGGFRSDLFARRRSNPPTSTDEDKKLMSMKTKNFPVAISRGEWHTLVLRTRGEEMFASLDGKELGSFQSEGIGHEHKSQVSLTTYLVDVHFDDFSLKGVAK